MRRHTTESGLSSWPHPYLQSIEQKRKKHTLLHEFGQGAPCLNCGDKCPGFSLHYWRKVCRNCRCAKEFHAIVDEHDPGTRRMGRLFDEHLEGNSVSSASRAVPSHQPNTSRPNSTNEQYEWAPPGASQEVVKKYMQSLPPEIQPIAGSDGAALRKRRLEHQIPAYDFDASACDNLTQTEVSLLEEFVDNVKHHVVGQGSVKEQTPQVLRTCDQCRQPMYAGQVAIFAARAGKDRCWHPQCFVCDTCNEILQDLIYYFNEGKIFCGRHFADSVMPRCGACDESGEKKIPTKTAKHLNGASEEVRNQPSDEKLIFNREYTQAEGKPWHVKHFCCHACDRPLAGNQYVPRDQNPYCLDCYDRLFGKQCTTCGKKIAPQEQRIVFNEFNYHTTPECFHCAYCGTPLVNRKFVAKPPKVFCSTECRQSYHMAGRIGE